HVVIKRPLEHLRADRNVAVSLRREARIGGRLRHPNLIAVLDAGEHDGYDYLVLEYVHGAPLRTIMQTETGHVVRELPLAVALGIVIDVARALHHAHELTDESGSPLGLVHRDVSPGNVLVDLDGSVKLADFGIAKETRVATLSGSMHGTVTYMAPEQCRGHAFDRRADIFSIGVILYELVTRRRLFWAENDVASLHRVLSGDVPRPRSIVPSLSGALEDIALRAVAHDPDRRFATARELADALEALAAVEGHVLGARWVARTVEEVVGARRAPWIAATTVPDPPRKGEGSLVSVIESLAADEPRLPTFGPADRRDAEEGSLPSSPAVPALAPKRSRARLYAVIAGGAAVGVTLAIVLAAGGSSTSTTTSTSTIPDPSPISAPVPVPAPAPAPAPAPVPAPAPAPVPVPAPAPVPAPVTETAPVPARLHRHHASLPPRPPPTAPPPAPPRTSVEWNPQLLLPTDSPGSAAKHPK
ncbi:MAG: serine/threonine-protein kinase, partial [Acidobacteriota bacterium]